MTTNKNNINNNNNKKKKTNAKKIVARQRPPRTRVQLAAAPSLDHTAARYMRCITQGIPANTGVPDGDGRLSIVFNRRHTCTLRPDANGVLQFRIGFNQFGNIHLIHGSTTNAIAGDYVAGSDGIVSGPHAAAWGPLVHPNAAQTSSGWIPDSHYGPVRLVNAKHTMRYIGPPLTSSGMVRAVEVTDIHRGNSRDFDFTHDGNTFRITAAHDIYGVSGILPPSAYVDKATRDLSILMLPRDTSYDACDPSYWNETSTPEQPYGIAVGGRNTPGQAHLGCPSHPSVRVRELYYTGLPPDAVISIDSEVCCQQIVDGRSPLYSFAKPSEAANQSWLNNFLSQVNTQPLVNASLNVLSRTAARAASTALGVATGYANNMLRNEL